MAPTTRPQNKEKHPGIPNLPVTQQPPSKPTAPMSKAKSKLECNAIIRKVSALETKLLTQQRETRAMAHQPPGPSQDKWPRSQPVHGSNLQAGLEGKVQFTYLMTKY